MPPAELSMSTVAFRVRIALAWSLTLSINACCEASSRGAVEYRSSTGRVRRTQPAVGSKTMNNPNFQKGERRVMKILRHLYDHLSIPKSKGFKTLVGTQ